MPARYHVFISYAREDSAFCDAIAHELATFGLTTFVDRKAIDPGRWPRQIERTLRSRSKPTVIAIASEAAIQSQWVRREVELADRNNLPVLVLQLHRDAVERLGWTEFQMIDLAGADQRVDDVLKDQLWLALHRKVITDKVSQFRREAQRWCRELLPADRPDFWEADWQSYFAWSEGSIQSCVLTAEGGSGKSVLLAHLITNQLEVDPNLYPIIVPLDILRAGRNAVSRFAGARSAGVLIEHINRIQSELGHRVLFVVDGLDRIAPSAIPGELPATLNLLAAASAVVVSCRTEVWDREYSEVTTRTVRVGQLKQADVDQILQENTSFPRFDIDVLRIPFYLDAMLRYQHHFIDAPRTRTDVLEAIWRAYSTSVEASIPRLQAAKPVLQRLAALQLRDMTFEVSRTDLESACQAEDELALETLAALEAVGTLRRRTMAGSISVRLPHDLLDCFNMTVFLIKGTSYDQGPMGHLSERADRDCGWQLLSMLIQYAHDRDNMVLEREVFGLLLDMLDRKGFSDWMAKSWAATYTLRDQFLNVCPLVLECLDGTTVDAPSTPDAPRASQLGPDARITQEAASSLASAFAVLNLDNWTEAKPELAIPILKRGLYRWPYRKRFVEGLAKYRNVASRRALEAFAAKELREHRDPDIMPEVAQALASIGGKSSLSILEGMVAAPGISARARRMAIEAKNLLADSNEPIPEIQEHEIIDHLSVKDAGGRYSDWRIIQEYARHAMRIIVNGQASPPLLSALVDALRHEHTFARVPVIECLGRADDAKARQALISEVLEPQLPSEVRQACIAALREQLRRAPTTAVRQARRWFITQAANRAEDSGALVVAKSLRMLMMDPEVDTGLLVVDSAFELPTEGHYKDPAARTSLTIVPSESVPIDPLAYSLIREADYGAVGAGRETKYRICKMDQSLNGLLQIHLTEDTWENGASFHLAMRRAGDDQAAIVDRLLERMLLGEVNLPGIAVLHCMVVTRDLKVILTRRSGDTPYAPNQWSASFEEQITATDLDTGIADPVLATGLRGLNEEFGLEVGPADCTGYLLPMIIEMPILNPAIVLVLELRHTFAQVKRSWTVHTAGKPDPEIVELQSLNATAEGLQKTIDHRESWDFHPTSVIRLSILLRTRRRRDRRASGRLSRPKENG